MKDRFSTLQDVALGAGLAVLVSSAMVMAQSRQSDEEPCCAVVSVNTQIRTVTAKVAKTGQTFTLTEIPAGSIGNFTVGAKLDLACAVPPNSESGATGNASNSGTTPTATVPRLPWVTSTSCGTPPSNQTGGTNVPRDASTRPTQPPSRQRPACVATTGAGVRTTMPCPDDVQVRSGK
jgi:hypothetical protein